MKEPVQVTLIQLRDYLLAQRPDKPIEMGTGYNVGPGCLMTQYGRERGFEFDYSSTVSKCWSNGDDAVAGLDGFVFDIFYRSGDNCETWEKADQIARRYSKNTCGYWQDMVKDKTNK